MQQQRASLTWPHRWPIVGMVHLLPLPGAPGWQGSIQAVLDRAVADAAALRAGGVDGLLVENYGDTPFVPDNSLPETIAALTLAVSAVLRGAGDAPVGVNVLRNDASAALGIAAATGARFMRVNVHTGAMLSDQGWLAGRAHETVRRRHALGARVQIWADVLVKHALPLPGADAGLSARDAWERGHADALIVSGAATGGATDASRLQAVRSALPDAPVWIGSGLDTDNAQRLLPLATGAIVGSSLQRGGVAGAGVERDRVARLMEVVSAIRARAS